ncbi:uncharacterized protein HD556DRAFT_41534 [Suillus plorans]|uniref:Uncharacterized protein n=1 Tax=Suillus plorans TaxID=116603 RepID=A0A9P7E473_9AGAM|nr:uncharacterized protein HD556DRAFT_41534 [Suillus plorans]KAG1810327.1 hypothetical protein HD556DRAFT_41534 [Suillus plorans]
MSFAHGVHLSWCSVHAWNWTIGIPMNQPHQYTERRYLIMQRKKTSRRQVAGHLLGKLSLALQYMGYLLGTCTQAQRINQTSKSTFSEAPRGFSSSQMPSVPVVSCAVSALDWGFVASFIFFFVRAFR